MQQHSQAICLAPVLWPASAELNVQDCKGVFMKFDVVKNVRDPWDAARKERRYAVVIEDGSDLVLLPCTTYFQRTGVVPMGSVLVSKHNSVAWYGCGFTADEVCVSLRDAFRVHRGSSALDRAVLVGMLNLEFDKRLADSLKLLMLQYLRNVTKCA